MIPKDASDDARSVMRQSFGGLLWSKQYYGFAVERWLKGDPDQPDPPPERRRGRNAEWGHLDNADVLSMPDKWEYPWYAARDLAFDTVRLALVDPDFAKQQLILLLREWYMHPNGQLPAYERKFSDVNPPVHAWAAWRVYKIDAKRSGKAGRTFLERVFHKLLLNFTWWVNRKDELGRNVFQGGFLGLDNIGVFDRSAPLRHVETISTDDGPRRFLSLVGRERLRSVLTCLLGRDYVLFYEYFHGDLGVGVGASHQTGWTGLVAKLLQQSGE